MEAASAGALVLAAVRHIWPMAREYKARRARAGMILALSIGAAATLLNGVLCAFTPYCL